MPCRTSIFDGIDVTTLQLRLTQMQTDLLDLMQGRKVESASYAQSDGSRAVTYTKASIGDLTSAITAVQSQIDALTGQRRGRRAPITPVFR